MWFKVAHPEARDMQGHRHTTVVALAWEHTPAETKEKSTYRLRPRRRAARPQTISGLHSDAGL